MDAADDALIGRTVADKFQIEALVGRGAMGAVYKARQLALTRKIALKVMRVHGAADAKYATRFKREAKTASLLDHPNLVRVLDFGQEPDGVLYIAMEYLEGRNLLAAIRDDWPLSIERVVAILSQTLSALAVAHEMGIVHRDLKPENIMLVSTKDDDGVETETVKVCDFGVAKFVEDAAIDPGTPSLHSRTSSNTTTLTAHGMTVGTPSYMPPEQALGEPTDARSDLYAVGVILFQLLTRRLPFEANTALKVMIEHIEKPVPAPSSIEPSVDPRLERVCLKALRKRPEKRYQSARDMRAEIRAVLGAPSGSAKAGGSSVTSADATGKSQPQSREIPTVPPSSPLLPRVRKGARAGAQGTGSLPRAWILALVLVALGAALALLGMLRR
jgi:serine/threonine protein kinase